MIRPSFNVAIAAPYRFVSIAGRLFHSIPLHDGRSVVSGAGVSGDSGGDVDVDCAKGGGGGGGIPIGLACHYYGSS